MIKKNVTAPSDRGSAEGVVKRPSRQSLLKTTADFLGVKQEGLYEYLRDLWVSDGPELTDQELDQGIALIARFDLDPLAREIYVKRTPEGRTLAVVTIDGWVKILDRCDHYDGFRQRHHTDSDGDVYCVETRIYSKHRKYPAAYRAYRSEYEAIAGMWTEKMPIHMLGNFSFRHCARLFMPLGGNVVTEEEAKIIVRSQQESVGGGQVDGAKDQSIRENDDDPFADQVADSDESWEPVGAIGAADQVPVTDERLGDPPRPAVKIVNAVDGPYDYSACDVAAMFGSFSTMDGQAVAESAEPVAKQDTYSVLSELADEKQEPEATEDSQPDDGQENVQADAERDAEFETWMAKFGTIRAAKTADAVLTLALGSRSNWTDDQCRQLTMRAIAAKQEVLAKK